MPTASRTFSATERRVASTSGSLRLGHDDQAFLAPLAVDAEGDDVAGPDALDVGDGPLDVLGEDVAAADDDHVLDAAADHQLAAEQVGEVAGPQPPVDEQLRGGVGPVVVAGRHRGAPDLQLADLALAAHLAGVGVADAQLEAGNGRAEQGEAAGAAGVGVAGAAYRSVSSTRRSTQSVTRPRIGSGNDPPIITSAMPKAGEHRPGRMPCGRRPPTNRSTCRDRPARRR